MDQEMKEYLDRKLASLAMKDDVEKLRQETKANFRQLREEDKTSITELRKETQTVLDQSNQVLASFAQQIKEAESLREQMKQVERFGEQIGQVESLRDEIKQMAEMITALSGKVSESLVERREPLVPATPVPYEDLEKRIRELEARVKTLEKMVLP